MHNYRSGRVPLQRRQCRDLLILLFVWREVVAAIGGAIRLRLVCFTLPGDGELVPERERTAPEGGSFTYQILQAVAWTNSSSEIVDQPTISTVQ